MIEVRNLTAGYRGKNVIWDVSLTFEPGNITILLGPNGCGKSTLLRTILGLQRPSGGQTLVDGVSLEKMTPRQTAQKMAYLPQSRGIPNISAYHMVLHGRFPYLKYPRRYRQEDHEAAMRALRWIGAEELADCFLPELSGGQRQKIYLAMALAQETQTILMDEPTTYLDVQYQMEVMRISRELANQEKSVVIVLHDLCLAMRTADRIAVLDAGQICRCGTPEDVYGSGILDRVFGVKIQRVWVEGGWQYYYA